MIKGMLRETYFYSDDPDAVAHLSALCPACGFEHSFRVDLIGHGKWKGDVWSFDGNYETPTFSPSMGSNLRKVVEPHPVCHSFLQDGVWKFLADCTHEMANQHVPMIPPEPEASFQRRHGWHLYPWTDDEGNPKQEGCTRNDLTFAG